MSKRKGPDTAPEPKRVRSFPRWWKYFTSWDIIPTSGRGPTEPWRMEFGEGLQSFFYINGISSAISGVSLRLVDQIAETNESGSTLTSLFEAQDLPPNLTVDVQRVREIEDELADNRFEFIYEPGDVLGSLTIARDVGVFDVYLRPTGNSERWNVTVISYEFEGENFLSEWWQYAKDDPEEVVNAASRRQDLLGL